jgi:[ribosomal protein S5]-alanine N-acetyltransferase
MPAPGLTDGMVLLRQWQLTDADWYADAARDPVIQRYTTESPTLTADQVRAAITELAAQTDAVGFVVCDATTGERLGNIALRHGSRTGEVSYWVAASARGRGVATRALRLLSDWAFATLELSEIRLWTHAGNAASRLVAERAGYRRAPGHDQQRTINGQIWNTVGYTRPAPARPHDSHEPHPEPARPRSPR